MHITHYVSLFKLSGRAYNCNTQKWWREKTVLRFTELFRRVSLQSIFFNGLEGLCRAQLEGICYLLSKNSISVSSPRVWHQITRPLTAISVLKLNSFFFYFLWRKGCYFRLYGSSQSFGLFLLPHPVRWFVRATIMNSTSSSLPDLLVLWSADSLTYILISSF